MPFISFQFEADRRTINITMNSFGTELSKDDRQKLFPVIGRLYPDGNTKLGRADDDDQVKGAIETFQVRATVSQVLRMN